MQLAPSPPAGGRLAHCIEAWVPRPRGDRGKRTATYPETARRPPKPEEACTIEPLAWFAYAFVAAHVPNKITPLGFDSLSDCQKVAAICSAKPMALA